MAKLVKASKVAALVVASNAKVSAGLEDLADAIQKAKTPEDLGAIYKYVNGDLKKNVEDLRVSVKNLLLEQARLQGDDNGVLQAGDLTLTRKVVRHKMPDAGKLTELLKSKGLKRELIFRQVVSEELDLGKLDALVEKGKLTAEEVDACRLEKSVSLEVK